MMGTPPTNQPPRARRLIGLTGGIATGKSTVADYLTQVYRLPVVDADLLARQAVTPGSPILSAIYQHFGPQVSLHDGTLDRRALGEIIFNQPQERAWLEAQIHPYVRQQLRAQTTTYAKSMVMVVPLLFEAKMTDLVTEIWVVACTPEQQLQRLQQRNQLSLAQAQARIASQMSLAKKVAHADVVLENTGDLLNLQVQIDRAWQGLDGKTGREFGTSVGIG